MSLDLEDFQFDVMQTIEKSEGSSNAFAVYINRAIEEIVRQRKEIESLQDELRNWRKEWIAGGNDR